MQSGMNPLLGLSLQGRITPGDVGCAFQLQEGCAGDWSDEPGTGQISFGKKYSVSDRASVLVQMTTVVLYLFFLSLSLSLSLFP